MPFGIGIWELLVLLGVLLLIFGPRKLPEMGRSLGTSLRELRDGLTTSGGPDAVEDLPLEPEKSR